jgi:PKD repeat protein
LEHRSSIARTAVSIGILIIVFWLLAETSETKAHISQPTSHLSNIEYPISNIQSDVLTYTVYFPLVDKNYTPLDAAFTYTPTTVYTDTVVYFSDQSLGSPTAWQWYFGDGELAVTQNPTHTYTLTGTYTVSLTVTNAYDLDIATDLITVTTPPMELDAAFTYTPTTVYTDTVVYFSDRTAGNPTAWQWDFGDGELAVTQNPTHTYALAGTYTVSLTVSSAFDLDVATDVITVTTPPMELVVNGGFEEDEAWYIGWTPRPAVYSTEVVHSGARSMRLGITDQDDYPSYSTIWQKVTIPLDASSATLSFWYYPLSQDSIENDWQEALILDANLYILAQVMKVNSNSQTWTRHTFDLMPYRGQTIAIYFNVHNDGEGDLKTAMYLDDVSVAVRDGTARQVYSGWAMEAYPELSWVEMRDIIRSQKEKGCNVVLMGHNNPGEVDVYKAEPGLSYAVYRAFIDPGNTLHDEAEAMVGAQYRMLGACREEGMKVILPVGYQIQMGEQWNAQHPQDLRTDYYGNPLDIGGQSASFYSSAYQADIRSYYEWVNANFVQPYKDIILMINLADEPQGADYSSHANAVFSSRYGYSFWEVGNDPQRWRQLGEFQANYIVEYAAWSANVWQEIDPEIMTTMSFCGFLARYGYYMPYIEPLFTNTPSNFAIAFDAYPRDGYYTDPITEGDLTSLFILIRSLGRYSDIYDKPIWLWSTANSWGLGQDSPDKADIADAISNIYYLAQLTTQTGGELQGINFWNYNVKGQGLYNDTNPIVYDPDEMFERVSVAGSSAREIMVSEPSPISVLLFAPSSYPYELIGKTKSWLHLSRLARDMPTFRRLISKSILNYRFPQMNALARNNVNSIVATHLTGADLEDMETVLVLAPSLAYVTSDELDLLYDFYRQGREIVAKEDIAEALKKQMKDPSSTAMTSYLTKITSAVSDGAVYSTSLDVETLFMDDYQGELAAFWRDVLRIEKLNRGYFVEGDGHALLYSIDPSPVSFDVDIPFTYEGARYNRSGRYVSGLSGSGTLAITIGHHEYARVYRVQ